MFVIWNQNWCPRYLRQNIQAWRREVSSTKVQNRSTYQVMCTTIRTCSKFQEGNYFHLQSFNSTRSYLTVTATGSSIYFRLPWRPFIVCAMVSRKLLWSWSEIEKILREDKIPYSLFPKYFKQYRWWNKNLPKRIKYIALQSIDKDPAVE